MKDVTTQNFIDRVVLTTRAAEQARIIYAIHPSIPNARKVSQSGRAFSRAMQALNRHLKDCVNTVSRETKKRSR